MNEELLEPWFRRIRVRKIMPWIPHDANVCDIGCGFEAKFLKSISSKIKRGYGFDRKVRTSLQGNLEIFQYDLHKPLPLTENSIDCITMLAVLEHLSDSDEVFSEIKRICRLHGRIILTTPTPLSRPLLEFLSFRLGIVSPEEITDHKHYWSLSEIQCLFERFGFRVIKIQTFSFGLNSFAVGEKISE